MASCVLYVEDLAAGKIAAGASGTIGIDATDSTGKEAYLSDVNQCTQWGPGASGTFDVKYELGTTDGAKNVVAFGFGNCEGLSGLTVTIYRSTSFGATTNATAFTAPSVKNFVVTLSAAASRWWTVRIASATSATKIGTISILSSAGAITLANLDAPRYPMTRPKQSGQAAIETASARVLVTTGGATQRLGLSFLGPSVASGGTWDTLESLFDTLNGFENGVWFTDDAFSSPGRAYYGHVLGGFDGQVTMANALVNGSLSIDTLPEGIKLS